MTPAEKHLTWFLRATACLLLCAAPAIVMPTAWMSEFYARLGLGDFPAVPLMRYLTRSVSALYATLGASYGFLSGDVRRYLPLLRFMVPCTAVFDAVLIVLDLSIPMPAVWTVGEGLAIVSWTAALWWLVRRCPDDSRGQV